LFAVACCWRIASLIDNELALRALQATEHFADGQINGDEWREISEAARGIPYAALKLHGTANLNRSACIAAAYCGDLARRGYPIAASLAANTEITQQREREDGGHEKDALFRAEVEREHLLLFDDIFGNPFHPVRFARQWRTSDVLGVARGIYDDRAFERMPILADALMDAGCEDEEIIGHCRGKGPHVRGCWVVDLVLGKT
jgi:hypothetical protein